MTAIAQVAPIAGIELAPTRSTLAAWISRIGAILRQIGPYAAIEILLPGGTLMALLLWLYRRGVSVRAQVRASESAAYAHLCMECGVANGHFDFGTAGGLRTDVPKEQMEASAFRAEAAIPALRLNDFLQLRAMNIIYETTKERGATILVPSMLVDSPNPTNAVALVSALAGRSA